MGCGKHDKFNNTNCVLDVVQFINDLQNAVEDDDCPTGCLNPVLGGVVSPVNRANTRPFILYTECGDKFSAFFRTLDGRLCKSFVFRVESVEDNCAVLRVLGVKFLDDCEEVVGDVSMDDLLKDCKRIALFPTSSCITVDLRCFCAIQCLEDLYLPGV
ncbi:MAG: cotZ [Bacillales bacterium]|jgi:spore coat protein Y|nr:cotZ [Bacillales bacterium]